MTKTNIKTTTYKINSEIIKNFFAGIKEADKMIDLSKSFDEDKFFFDIVDDGEYFEAWLYSDDEETKMFVERCAKSDFYIEESNYEKKVDSYAECIEDQLIEMYWLADYCEAITDYEVVKAYEDWQEMKREG